MRSTRSLLLVRCCVTLALVCLVLSASDAVARSPSSWVGSICGIVQCAPPRLECTNVPTHGQAITCACEGRTVCPGLWRSVGTGTWVTDPSGNYHCTVLTQQTTCENSGVIASASPTANACPPGYQSRGVPGLNPPEFYTCVPQNNPPPSENENRGFPDEANLCPLGNPINPANGNKLLRELDYRSSGLVPLAFERFYNSDSTTPTSTLGPRWRHSFDRSVRFVNNIAYVFRADGRADAFKAPAGSNTFGSESRREERLTRKTDALGTTQGWTLVTATNNETEEYDATGRLIEIRDRAALTISLLYSDAATPSPIAPAAGFLIRVSNSLGKRLHLTYDASGRIRSMSDPALDRPAEAGDPQYEYAYGADGDLERVRFPDGTERHYHYNEPGMTIGGVAHALTGITDENGVRFANYRYDADGRAVESEHAGGAGRVRLQTLPGGGARVENFVSEGLSSVREYSFSVLSNVSRSTSISGSPWPGCGPKARTYDPNGFLGSTTDWNGNLTQYSHDARGLETLRVEAAGTPQERRITTEWHPFYRLPARIAEPLRITTFLYGEPTDPNPGTRGSMLSRTIQATNDASGAQGFSATPIGTPRTFAYTYNQNGQVLTVDGPRTDVPDATSNSYSPNDDPDVGKRGSLATTTNALGHVTQITGYDAHGKPLTIVDPNGLVTALTYDARQRLTSRSVGGELTSFEYDEVGQLTRVTLPDGSFLAYTYDAAHRPIQIADNLGNRVTYTLDLMGNRTREDVFDPASQLAQTRSRVYSNLNRLVQEIGGTSPATQVTSYGYDNQGNVTSITDPLNRVTVNAYDALNRLKQLTDPANGVTGYGYDGLDQLVLVSDPRSNTTGYTVDGLGNLVQQSSPDTGTTTSTHDAAGNLTTSTDAKGQSASYTYDALNRVTRILYNQATGSQLKQVDYVYDQGVSGIGRLTSVTETSAVAAVLQTTAYGYDQKGRIVSETRAIAGQTYTTAYAYDAAGRMTGITYPSGRTTSYGLDGLGRVSRIETTDGGETRVVVQDVTYQPLGPAKGFTFGNLQTYARSFDLDGRIASHSLAGPTKQLSFDAASRITQIAEPANPANTNTYGYDALDRLTNAVLPASTFAYSYDAMGNRLSKSIGGSTDIYSYPAMNNRLVSVTGASGTRSYLHDANGSITGDGLNTFGYDARGRLASATSGTSTTTFQVNALGQRVRKTSTPGDTIYHYDAQGRLIAESTATGTPIREYFWLADQPVAVAVHGQAVGGCAANPTVDMSNTYVPYARRERMEVHSGRPGERGWEWGLGTNTRDFDVTARADLDWVSGKPYGFVLIYDGAGNARVTVRDGTTELFILTWTGGMDVGNALRFMVRSPAGIGRENRISVVITSIDGEPVADTLATAGNNAFSEVVRVYAGASLQNGYAVEGTVTFTFAGGYPPRGNKLDFTVTAGNVTCQGPVQAGPPALYYVHADHLNTPRAITNDAQQLVWRWEHQEPFGRSPPEENPSGLGNFEFNLRFPGQYFDLETTLPTTTTVTTIRRRVATSSQTRWV